MATKRSEPRFIWGMSANNCRYITLSQPAKGGARWKTFFSVALILATVLPIVAVLAAPMHQGIVTSVNFLVALGATHVFATTYLFTDPAVRSYIKAHPVRMGVVPLILLFGGIALLSIPSSPLFYAAVLGFFVYQTWHFGAQNIGVATFVSFTDRGRPLLPAEKTAIKCGIVCGMLGILKGMAPGYFVGPENMQMSEETLWLIDGAFRLGAISAALTAAAAVYFMLRAWREKYWLTGVSLFLSICFLLPMYIGRDYMVGIGSTAIAHGLQYLIFLSVHSGANKPAGLNWRYGVFIAPAMLLLIVLFGHMLWSRAPTYKPDSLPTVGIAVLFSLTLVHFWLDQYLWRMKDKDRASWIKERFAFIFAR